MLETLALLTLLHAAPQAAQIAGTWEIKGDVVGTAFTDVCTIVQTGTVLSGSCTGEGGKAYELKGEAKDGKITFSHGGEYEGAPLTQVYTVTVASATEIKGTVLVQPFDAGGEFSAKLLPAKP